MTPDQGVTLRWFRWEEFRRPERVEYVAAKFLDDVRDAYGSPLTVTSDARVPEENTRVGGSPTSWHLKGRAFDLRYPPTAELAWRLVSAVFRVAGARPVELELVYSEEDRHVHLALKDGGASRLVVAAT